MALKKSIKTKLIPLVIALVVVILAIGLYVKTTHEVKRRLDIGYGVTVDTTYVQLQIGDKVFAIPKNHIWSRRDWKGGRVTGTNLQALLPDFEPLRENNRQEFEKNGWHREISLHLSEHAMPANESETGRVSMTRREVYERKIHNQITRDVDGIYGLRRQEFPGKDQPSSAEDIFVGIKPDGNFYWVLCNREGTVSFPSCSTYLEYSTHVYVKYTFSKEWLPDWIKIDDGVFKLISKFEGKHSQGENK